MWVSLSYFKRFRDLLKQVVIFNAIKKILRDLRSKNFEQMALKVSRETRHRTPNRTLHFALEICYCRFIIIISYDTRVFTLVK